jgi:aminoglycoside phosphotransferase (APT) family kinase protein
MDRFPTSLVPLAGGHSGETFLAEAAGEATVVRVYGPRSAPRGPLAPEIDAAVLDLVRGLLPVPDVLEVRRGDPDLDLPGLLVTSRLPGERLDLVLPGLDADRQAVVGTQLGTLLGRLGHMAQPRAGTFVDRTLALHDLPDQLRELPAWVDAHADRLEAAFLDSAMLGSLRSVAADAQDLADENRRVCLVHGDFNAKNLLVDPATLEVTAVLDWEFAMAGSPYADLGNLLRFERAPACAGAVVAAYRDFMPSTPDDLLDRARAADLFALVELAAREEEHDVVVRCRDLLAAVARTGDLHVAMA